MEELRAPKGATKKKRIKGRGIGSNRGGTSGRGNKGQNSRAGGGVRPGFEGGQMPLYRRIARRGFSNYMFKQEFHIVNLGEINKHYASGETVNEETLRTKKLIKGIVTTVKILGMGEIDKKLTFAVDKISASARAKIEAAGGAIQAETKA